MDIRWVRCLVVATVAAAGVGCVTTEAEPPVFADQTRTLVELTVGVVGAETDGGWIAVAIYGSPETFADRREPVAAVRLPVQERGAIWRVPVLRPGRYAVAAFHDRDADGELDRSAVGAPSERYGFSNDARGRFGPPSFDEAAVTLHGGPAELTITLR